MFEKSKTQLKVGDKHWTIRRRLVYGCLIFCAWIVVNCLTDKSINEEVATVAITQAFNISGAILMAYIFGAVWDDKGRVSSDQGTKEDPQS